MTAVLVRSICDHPYRSGCPDCRRIARERRARQRDRIREQISGIPSRRVIPATREEIVDLGYGRSEVRRYQGPVLVEKRPVEARGEKPVAQSVRARGKSRGKL